MMKTNKIEILAPAGSFDSVVAAVRCGADAVYLGAKEFSARASAKNFDYEELKNAVEYCHERGVLVYLTVNTVVFDSELPAVADLIKKACNAHIDAVIVQNTGVARLIKTLAPDLPLHGSTQMSVHTLSGAKALYEMGFKRVVLAREMTREEIRHIALNCPIELEVFVHGALCMCISGQCYFSAMLGSRSGSRGACAQPCRLPFSVGNFKDGNALSLKDNSLVDYITELQEMGVASAKIEGRMKRPEYVASAVTACRESRDLGFVSDETKELLTSVFSRTGFTHGYYTGKRGYDMFGTRQKENVVAANDKLLAKIRKLYKDETQRVGVSFDFSAEINKKPRLVVSDGKNTVRITGENPCEKAVSKPLSQEKCIAQLKKTGATPYFAKEINCSLEKDVTMPLSALNKIRRDALEKLSDLRIQRTDYRLFEENLSLNFEKGGRRLTKKYAKVKSTDLGNAFKEFDLVFVPLFSENEKVKKLINEGFKIGAEIPPAMFSADEKIAEKLKEMKALGINHVYCSNIGAVYIAKQENMKIHGGFRLNFTNTLDLLWAEKYGFEDTELSLEITLEQARLLGGAIPVGIVSYGYLPLMISRNCPNKSRNISCKQCGGMSKMQDRLGKKFILMCDKTATEVLNCVPLKMLDKLDEFKNLSFHTLAFTVENHVESVEKYEDLNSNLLFSKDFTRGLYFRGVK